MINDDSLFSIKKHTDTLIEQTMTETQETLEFILNKQMGTFSFSSPINSIEEGEWLLGVTSSESTKSVFNITDENITFSFTTPGHWFSRGGQETITKLRELLAPRQLNDNELHVKEVKTRGNKKKETKEINYLILILIKMR